MKERKKERQKDMGLKLMSKPDVITVSGVMYPHLSKKILNDLQNFQQQKLVFKLNYFKEKKSIYLFIKENVAINTTTNIKFIFS